MVSDGLRPLHGQHAVQRVHAPRPLTVGMQSDEFVIPALFTVSMQSDRVHGPHPHHGRLAFQQANPKSGNVSVKFGVKDGMGKVDSGKSGNVSVK